MLPCFPGGSAPPHGGTEYYSFFLGGFLSRTLPTTQICVMAPSRGWEFSKKKKRYFQNPQPLQSTIMQFWDVGCMLDNNHHKRNYSTYTYLPLDYHAFACFNTPVYTNLPCLHSQKRILKPFAFAKPQNFRVIVKFQCSTCSDIWLVKGQT